MSVACTCTPPEIVAQLVGIVDAGVARPLCRAIPGSAAGLRFGQLCLRKLYVLAARGAEASQPQGCLLQVPAPLLLASRPPQLRESLWCHACRLVHASLSICSDDVCMHADDGREACFLGSMKADGVCERPF